MSLPLRGAESTTWRGRVSSVDVLKRWCFYSLASSLVGAGITFLAAQGEADAGFGTELAAGAFIGVVISTVIFFLELTVVDWMERHTALPAIVIRIPAYVLGGMGGFLLAQESLDGVLLSKPLVPLGDLRWWLPFIGILSLVVGLLIFGYELMRARLADSLEQLKEQEFAQKELELARSIQKRLMPPGSLEGPGFEVAAQNLAADYVAGDFYDVLKLGGEDIGLVVADVAGKGMGASLIMASAKAMVPFIAAEHTVAETLTRLNGRLAEDLGPREFVALLFARFSPADGVVEIGNAGLPDPYIIGPGGEVRAISVDGERLPLGAKAGLEYSSRRVKLEVGDRLLLMSDGLAEAPTRDGLPLGYEGLQGLFPEGTRDAREWIAALFEAVAAETAPGAEDDWTALLLGRIGAC